MGKMSQHSADDAANLPALAWREQEKAPPGAFFREMSHSQLFVVVPIELPELALPAVPVLADRLPLP
jgi:hypothetical protein